MDRTGDARARALWRAAATLERTRCLGNPAPGLPTVFFITDPDRTPDPVAVAGRLPRGAGVIFRSFGRAGAEAVAVALMETARRRGLLLLIGADVGLARKVGAAGVHLPERDLWRAPELRRRHPGWLLTGAAHSAAALRRAQRAGVDGALLSAVFPSSSPSAGRPIGVVRLAALVRTTETPVFALGGVNGATAGRLVGTGVSGFAAAEGLL
jgi:thiamine-phosphate pyrophosphorylase